MVIAFDEGYSFMKKVIEKSREFQNENMARKMADKDKYIEGLLKQVEEAGRDRDSLKVKLAQSGRAEHSIKSKYTQEKKNSFL